MRNPGSGRGKIQWLYDQGVRIASLCWNDENALATGVKGTVTCGLTEEGRKAVRKMDELGMILDVSHTNEKNVLGHGGSGSWSVNRHSPNTRALCEVHRNLTDQQIMAIAAKGGVIGLNAARNFIDSNPEHQDVCIWRRTAVTLPIWSAWNIWPSALISWISSRIMRRRWARI